MKVYVLVYEYVTQGVVIDKVVTDENEAIEICNNANAINDKYGKAWGNVYYVERELKI